MADQTSCSTGGIRAELPCVLLEFNPSRFAPTPEFRVSLQERFTVLQGHGGAPLDVETAARVQALVAGRASSDLIDSLPNLSIIACPAAGFDGIDIAACRRRGISVTNVPAISSADVADLAILLMLAASRRLCAADRYVRQGSWRLQGDFMLTRKASGRRVGIVGLGHIGSCIARRAEAFGCSISYHGRSSKPDVPYVYHADVVVLAKDSDVIFVSCASTNETRHLIDRTVLDALGPQGTLVNVARGEIVNEVELIAALKEGRLGSAALDVFETEPMIPMELWSMDNVVLTPHIGNATTESRRAMGQVVVANLQAHFSGKPLVTPVN